MARLPIVSWIGNAAAVLVGGWGAVSREARAAGCSRQIAYEHARKVRRAVLECSGGGSTRGELQEELQQQRERAAQLEQRLAAAIEFPESEQQQFVATAAAMGLSYSQARELLKIVVKKNVPVGRRSRDG
jgi:hypothetical protein